MIFPLLASFCFCSKYVLSWKYPADVYLLSWWRDWLPNVLLCLLARALGVRSPSPSLFFFSQACHPPFRSDCLDVSNRHWIKPISFGDYCFVPMPPYDFSFTCMSFWFHSMTVQVALLKYLLHLNKQKFLQAC